MEISYLYGTAYMKNKNVTNHLIFFKLEDHTLKRCKDSSILYNSAGKSFIYIIYLYINIYVCIYGDSHLIKLKNI